MRGIRAAAWNRVGVLAACVVATGVMSSAGCVQSADTGSVRVIRAPNGGIAPDARFDAAGNLHVVFAAEGAAWHAVSRDDGATFGPAARISRPPLSTEAGMFRGPELAIGKDDEVHVAWYARGQPLARPAVPQRAMHSTGRGSFDRPVDVSRGPADGVSIAAAGQQVVVAWHTDDLLELSTSRDGGDSFAAPVRLQALTCECCDTSLSLTAGGPLYVMYRDRERNERDMYLVEYDMDSRRERRLRLDTEAWRIDACPMSSAGIARIGSTLVTAWEHAGRILMSRVDLGRWVASAPSEVSKSGKYPVVAAGGGVVLVAWKRQRRLHWRSYDPDTLRPLDEGSVDDGGSHRPAAVALQKGGFLLIP